MLWRRWTRSYAARQTKRASNTTQTRATGPPPLSAATAARTRRASAAPATTNLIAAWLRSPRLGLLLQSVGGIAQQEVAHLVLHRPAQQQPEHAARIGLERIGGAGAAAAEVFERPPSHERLRVALLLLPANLGGLDVAEAKQRPDRLDLRVGLRLDELGAAVRVALEHLDVLEGPLPVRRVLDVRGDVEAAPDRRIDLAAALPADGAHARQPSARCADARSPRRRRATRARSPSRPT